MRARGRAERILRGPARVEKAFGPGGSSAEGRVAAVDDPVGKAISEGFERGFTEGRELALTELSAEVDRFRAEAAASLTRLSVLEQALVGRLEAALLEAVVEAASRVVRERVDAADPVATRALREALDTLPATATVRVRLNPDDMDAITRSLGPDASSGRLELVTDDGISRGGCFVESAAGLVDAKLETALDAVARATRGEP